MPDTNHEILATTTSVYKIDNPSPGKYVVNEQASDEAGPPDLHSQNRKELSLSTPVPGLKVRPTGIIGPSKCNSGVRLWATTIPTIRKSVYMRPGWVSRLATSTSQVSIKVSTSNWALR